MSAAAAPHALIPDVGISVLDDRERIDFAKLRQVRRERVFQMMEEAGLDACVFGRQANIRYVSGARRLWLPESTPFSPTCVVVRASRTVRLLSASASFDGIPEPFQPEDILVNTWSPTNAVTRIGAAPSYAEARRVGFDGMSPLYAQLLAATYPQQTLVPAEGLMRDVRRPKLAAEVLCMRTAVAIAEACLQAASRQIAPATPEKRLQGAFLARMCELGVQTFAQMGTFTAIGPNGDLRTITGHGVLPDGAPVALAGGVLWAGYEGSLARTAWCGRQGPTAEAWRPYRTWADLMQVLVEACRPGATGTAIHAAFSAAKPPAGAIFSVYALGMGHEGKIAGSSLDPAVGATQSLQADMVVGVRVFVPGAAGGYLGEDMVLIAAAGNEVLTTLGAGPLAVEPVS